MHLKSYLVRSRHGIYYLRYQRNGFDKRVSLKTRDHKKAAEVAYSYGALMAKNPYESALEALKSGNVRSFELKDKDFYIKTDGSAEDNASAIIALEIYSKVKAEHDAQNKNNVTLPSLPSNLNSITLEKALDEYFIYLARQKLASKSVLMAKSVLLELSEILGSEFPVHHLEDSIIEKKWVEYCIETKKNGLTTIKRNLSFIKKFADWASKPAQNYLSNKITYSVEGAKSEHWEYWDKNDLQLIFENLVHVDHAWQFWIPLIGLYTGARIGEISSMKVENIYQKLNLDIMFLPGTKTDASPRENPIHPDLIKIGLLEYAKNRRDQGAEMLFAVKESKQNGFGGNTSKWFGRFIRDLGITNKSKTFSSFRHTITDHLNQMQSSFEANCQYTGHSKGGGVKGQTYGRKLLSLSLLKQETIDKINWQNYCGWSPSIHELKNKADVFVINNI